MRRPVEGKVLRGSTVTVIMDFVLTVDGVAEMLHAEDRIRGYS